MRSKLDEIIGKRTIKEMLAIIEKKEGQKEEELTVDLEGRLIDLNPSDKGNTKTQDNWIAYFNDKNEIMVSMPDIYLAEKSGNQNLLDSLRKDFKDTWIVSSTRIKYTGNNARIIHYFNQGKLIKPIEHNIVVPDYYNNGNGTYLNAVPNVLECEAYLQALFETKDNISQIQNVLEKLSNYKADKTKLWTPSMDDRNKNVERVSGFGYGSGVFRVNGSGSLLGGSGRSRGVRISAAGAELENFRK